MVEEREARVQGTAYLSFDHAPYAVFGAEIIEVVSAVRREEFRVEPGGDGLLLSGGEGGIVLLEDESADEKERTLVAKGACGAEDGL